MTVQKFLRQCYLIECQINAKLEQISLLRELATKVTSTLSHDKVQGAQGESRIESCIARLVDLEQEVNGSIDRLVDIRREVQGAIGRIADVNQRTLLELRYLNFKTLEEIAAEMGYSWRHIHRLHNKALEELKDVIECHPQPVL